MSRTCIPSPTSVCRRSWFDLMWVLEAGTGSPFRGFGVGSRGGRWDAADRNAILVAQQERRDEVEYRFRSQAVRRDLSVQGNFDLCKAVACRGGVKRGENAVVLSSARVSVLCLLGLDNSGG